MRFCQHNVQLLRYVLLHRLKTAPNSSKILIAPSVPSVCLYAIDEKCLKGQMLGVAVWKNFRRVAGQNKVYVRQNFISL